MKLKRTLIPEDASLTFFDYFKLNADVEEILAEFGYGFEATEISWPTSDVDTGRVAHLSSLLRETVQHVSLTSEIARREFLIGPILMEVIHHCHAKVRSEYAIEVSNRLKGTIDYFVRAKGNLLIVEAKQGDLTRGFAQLAIEMVAVDQSLDGEPSRIHGAISTGEIWRFGYLDRLAKKVKQDIRLYDVPNDLAELLGILLGILRAEFNPSNAEDR